MLKAFLRSAEFRLRADALALSYIKTTPASQGEQPVNGSPVGHLVSVGSLEMPEKCFVVTQAASSI